MTKLSDLNPSQFMKPKDVPRDGLELTIRRIEKGTLVDVNTHKQKIVYTAHWQEPGVKPLTLNKVNTNTLIAWFGDVDIETLTGKSVRVIRVWGESYGKSQWMVRIDPPDEIGEEEPVEETSENTPGNAAPGETPSSAAPSDEIPF